MSNDDPYAFRVAHTIRIACEPPPRWAQADPQWVKVGEDTYQIVVDADMPEGTGALVDLLEE